MDYYQISNKGSLPEISNLKPFKCVVVVEEEVDIEWQRQVSEWLVKSGCLYMMAWGKKCSSWDDSVDEANLKEWSYEDIPDESFVMTTWHEKESLSEVMWFAVHSAFHETCELEKIVVLHIAKVPQEFRFREEFKNA